MVPVSLLTMALMARLVSLVRVRRNRLSFPRCRRVKILGERLRRPRLRRVVRPVRTQW